LGLEWRRSTARDIAALRRVADTADAAIQRWKSLLEMVDSDWRDVIDNNLNGTANTIRLRAEDGCAKRRAASSCSPRCKASTAPRDASSYSAWKWASRADDVSGDGFGQHNITVTAIIPGVVDAPLIRYEKRLLESIGEIAGRRWKT
jgi:NAD(P)-dependent dehydrogenase (short-subunit alcohol dehydrogenase family)